MDSQFPVYCRPEAYQAFNQAMSEVDTCRGLVQAAVAMAMHDQPDANASYVHRTIEEMASAVRGRVRSSSPEALLAHLHDVLFDLIGLRGNEEEYYDPRNSYLQEVLRRRRGIPITLVLVYKCVAAQVGVTVHGINAPGHFLAEVELHNAAGQNDGMYVDPFYGGGILALPEVHQRIADATGRPVPKSPSVLSRATHRQWLARMLHNLQAVFASSGRERDLLAMQELHGILLRPKNHPSSRTDSVQ